MSISINIKSQRSYKGYTFITGFHGIGVTGYITTRHIVETLGASYIGYVESELNPSFVGMDEERLVFPFEFYEYKDIILLMCRFQPHRLEQKAFSKVIAEWVVNSGFKQAVLVGGLDNRFQQEDDNIVRCIHTKRYSLKSDELGVQTLEKGLFVTGPLALMLMYFEINNFPGIALLPYAEQGRPDPRAASNAIKVINKICGLEINTEQLLSDAETIEKELREVIEQQEVRDTEGNKGMYV